MPDPKVLLLPFDRGAFASAMEAHKQWQSGHGGVRAVFRQIDFRDQDLRDWDLSDAHFEDCTLSFAQLSIVPEAQFINCTMYQCDFSDSLATGVKFLGCTLESASMEKGDFTDASFIDCSLKKLRGQAARLFRARFSDSSLQEADLSSADLRQATGFILDETLIRHADISPTSRDAWSTLRRTYTGPRLAINLLLLASVVLVLVVKSAVLVIVSVMPELPIGVHNLAEYCERTTCKTYHLSYLFLAINGGWFPLLYLIFSLTYNSLRAYLTLAVSGLREEEDRTGRAPAYRMQEKLRPGTRHPRTLWAAGSPLRQSYRWMAGVHSWMTALLVVTYLSLFGTFLDVFDARVLLPTQAIERLLGS